MARDGEMRHGREMAGPLGFLLEPVARRLHYNESLHLHDLTDKVEDCGYCWLRAGNMLGVLVKELDLAGTPEWAGGVSLRESLRSELIQHLAGECVAVSG